MFSLQEYQHVHLLWFKEAVFYFSLKTKSSTARTFALLLTCRVKAQWARAAPALPLLCFYACGVKPGSTEALAPDQ